MTTFATGCLESTVPEIAPGSPSLDMNGPWIQGTESRAKLHWPNQHQCHFEDWSCIDAKPRMTVLSLSCTGCVIVDDPTGETFVIGTDVRAVPTSDGPIRMDAVIRFESTGETATVTETASADREVALEVECGLIEEEVLARAFGPGDGSVYGPKVRSCDQPRRPSEAVVLAPGIRTLQGHLRVPFCSDDSECQGFWQEQLRPRSSVMIMADSLPIEPTAWGRSEAFAAGGFVASDFAALPWLPTARTLTVRTTLATGEPVEVSIAVPPFEAP